jgi:chromosome segregation ATPase
MTTSEIVTIAISSLIALASAFWALFQHAQRSRDAHLDERHRATQDALKDGGNRRATADETTSDSRRDLWKKINEVEGTLTRVQLRYAKLEGTLVTRDYLNEALEKFEERQDRRMDELNRRLGALNGHGK